MRPLVKFYADPAIGSPFFGWAIRLKKSSTRGFLFFKERNGSIALGVWWMWYVEPIRIH